jgi:hypothetical protein
MRALECLEYAERLVTIWLVTISLTCHNLIDLLGQNEKKSDLLGQNEKSCRS